MGVRNAQDGPPSSQQAQASPNLERTTFLTGREVIEQSVAVLGGAVERLQALDLPLEDEEGSGERRRLLRDSLVSLQRELSGALERFVADGRDDALDRGHQYTADGPGADPGPPPRALDAMLAWALDLTRTLRARFRGLAASAEEGAAREAYAGLVDLADGYAKRIARLAEGGHDL